MHAETFGSDIDISKNSWNTDKNPQIVILSKCRDISLRHKYTINSVIKYNQFTNEYSKCRDTFSDIDIYRLTFLDRADFVWV